MCGFVGVVELKGQAVSQDTLVRMRDLMTHRGPDDAGLLIQDNVGLGHRRLSVVDLSPAGRQPMHNEDSTIWIVVNGEIYNHEELRVSLRRKGHVFQSRTDSEVILHLYEDEGERCLDQLIGMFGFVIWDSRRRRVFGARDRTGIKPFYYYLDHERFICASECKAIHADARVPRVANPEFFADYLYAGYSQGDKTPFRGIRQLLPGHKLTLSNGQLSISKYWDVAYAYNHTRDDRDVIEEMRLLLDQTMLLHCRSDAPVGCHLSGGLDSSAVVGFTARHYSPLKTFSTRFAEDACFDETPYARAVSRYLGTEHLEATPHANELARLFPSLIWHLEVPMPTSSAFGYYATSLLAVQHVKVALTGHGGDEVFAGYPPQFQAAFGHQSMFDPIAVPRPRDLSGLARAGRLLRNRGIPGVANRIWRRFAPGQNSLEDVWISLHCGPAPADQWVLRPEFVRSMGGYTPREDYLRPLQEASSPYVLDRCLYHDLRSYLPGLLHMEDRLSMAVSLESRVPLLDHRIIEFLATVPPDQKVRNQEPKALLRSAAGSLLPPEVRDRRDKIGFYTPVVSFWLERELAPLVRRVLSSPECLDRGILNPDELRRERLPPEDVWAAFNIELWCRLFLDGRSPPTASSNEQRMALFAS